MTSDTPPSTPAQAPAQAPARAQHLGIIGSRNYPHLNRVREFVEWVASRDPDVVFVSGGARGVDNEVANTVTRLNLNLIELLPDWERHGKKAGFLRNRLIIERSDKVVAFWDLESKGSRLSIGLALEQDKLFAVYGPDGTRLPHFEWRDFL